MSYRGAVTLDRRTPAIEDYTKVIYGLREWGDDAVTTSRLAERLGVSKASVSAMVRKLSEQGLVTHAPYGDVELTDAGMSVAMNVVRRHRLLELYLVEMLGYGWDEVHDEAEVLEHAVSDELLERMCTALGHPTRDPHGDPIPNHDHVIDEPGGAVLAELPVGTTGVVARVADSSPDILRYLADLGIRPDQPIAVLDRQPFGGPLVVRVGDTQHALGERVTRAVTVQVN